MFTIKIFEFPTIVPVWDDNWFWDDSEIWTETGDGVFIRTINEINDLSFSAQIDGGQGELRIETVDDVSGMSGNVVRAYQTLGTSQKLVYSGVIGKVTQKVESSREFYEISATGLASLLGDILYYEIGPAFDKNSIDPAQIVRDIVDSASVDYPNLFSYDAESIIDTGIIVSVNFSFDSCLTAIGKVAELSEFFWNVDENGVVSFKPRTNSAKFGTWYGLDYDFAIMTDENDDRIVFNTGATIDHALTVGKDIGSLTVEEDRENVVNDYWLTWDGGTERVSDGESINRYGRRFKYESKTQITSGGLAVAQAFVDENKDPIQKVSATVGAWYPFFDIDPGQVLQFRNFGYIPALQVSRISYTRNDATLELESYDSLSKEILNT